MVKIAFPVALAAVGSQGLVVNPVAGRGTLILTANSMQNLAHFRAPLVTALDAAGFQLVALAPEDGAPFSVPLRRLSIPIDRKGINPWKDLGTIRAYRSRFAEIRPAAVLSFTPKANIYGALAARGTGIPFIPNVSGLGTAFLRGGVLKAIQSGLYRMAFAHCPAVIFQNEDDRDLFLTNRHVRDEQARLIAGSGIDLGQFAPVASPGNEEPHFLFIGRMLADKGVRELAGAARILKGRAVPFRLTLIGDLDSGNPSAIEAHKIAEWEQEGLLTWAGRQVDVRPYIAAADAIVLPSYREGMPRALLEAAAMGRPMVATDVPGCRDVVKHGRTGLLCEARNPRALAEAMERMAYLDAPARMVMGAAARELAETRFDATLIVRQYLDLLAELGL